jgi:hypothetical protein
MEQLGSHWTDFHETWYLSISWKSVEKIQAYLKSDTNNSYFTWTPIYTFIISRSILLIMRYVSDKICRENQNKVFVYNNSFFFENRAFYEIVWKNVVQPVRPQMTIRRMRIAYWIPKSTNTHSEYVILTAFPPQQRLHERPSMLRYTYIVSLFYYYYCWSCMTKCVTNCEQYTA